MVAETLNSARTKNRAYLLLLIALFVIPLTAAWLLTGRWQPGATVNHGELLEPVRPITALWLQQTNGQELDAHYLQGRWTLAYLTKDCAQRCRDALYAMRQVRLALGKDLERAQTLLMITEPSTEMLRGWLQREHSATTVGLVDSATRDVFLQAFPSAAALGEWIYLIDPLGNLLMRYSAKQTSPIESKGILEDLKRLFKYSQIG